MNPPGTFETGVSRPEKEERANKVKHAKEKSKDTKTDKNSAISDMYNMGSRHHTVSAMK